MTGRVVPPQQAQRCSAVTALPKPQPENLIVYKPLGLRVQTVPLPAGTTKTEGVHHNKLKTASGGA
jgi:hypothetical protein